MPRYVRILLWSCLGVLLALAIVVALLATMNWNMARPWVSQRISQVIHRPVEIRGDLDVDWLRPRKESEGPRWLPWPQITANQVVVGNPAWADEGKTMAEASRLIATIDSGALFHRVFRLSSLHIEDASVLLERNEGGAVNWTLSETTEESKTPSKWTFDLQSLSLTSVRAQVIDATKELDFQTEFDSIAEPGADGYGLEWKAKGRYRQAELTGEGKSGGVLSLRDGAKPFPLKGEVSVGTTTIGLEGSVTRPQSLAALDVRLTLAGDTMADLLPLLGIALPETPPYETEGRLIAKLDGDADVWRYEEFKGLMGKSDLRGTLEYHRRKPRPLLTGQVESRLLRLRDLGPLIGLETSGMEKKEKKASDFKQPADKALPAKPLNTESWKVMDADVQFAGEKILRDEDLPLDNIKAHVVLSDSVLSLKPLNFGFAGGTLANNLVLDGRDKRIKADLSIQARHLKLKQLFPGAERMDASFGELFGDAKLKGQGVSLAELLGNSNGELQAVASRGTISRFLLEAAGLNVANMVMVQIFGDEQVVMDCLASDFAVEDGVMRTRVFRLETDDAVVDVEGRINLAEERLDLQIRPQNKTVRIFTLRSPLYARGTFKNPDVGVEKGPLAARVGAAVALGVIATPFAAILPLLNVGTDQSTGCSSFASAKGDTGKAAPAKQEAGKETQQSNREQQIERTDDAGEKDEAGFPKNITP